MYSLPMYYRRARRRMVNTDHQSQRTSTYELGTRVALGNVERNLQDQDQYLWMYTSQGSVLTISERSRYSPAGREAGITTLCLPVSSTYQPPKRPIKKAVMHTVVSIDDIGRPLLGLRVEET